MFPLCLYHFRICVVTLFLQIGIPRLFLLSFPSYYLHLPFSSVVSFFSAVFCVQLMSTFFLGKSNIATCFYSVMQVSFSFFCPPLSFCCIVAFSHAFLTPNLYYYPLSGKLPSICTHVRCFCFSSSKSTAKCRILKQE